MIPTLLLVALLGQAPITLPPSLPPMPVQVSVAVQTLARAAALLHATPNCDAAGVVPVCPTWLSDADDALVRDQVAAALVALRNMPERSTEIGSELLVRLEQQLGSRAFERLYPYVQLVRGIVGPFLVPAVTRRLLPDGTPVRDDQ